MSPARLKLILETVNNTLQLPDCFQPADLKQIEDLIHYDDPDWTLTTLGEMELEDLLAKQDTTRNVLRDLAEHLIEARNSGGHPKDEQLSMIHGGIADELLQRANAVLGHTLPNWN